jgi:hypothetical protein
MLITYETNKISDGDNYELIASNSNIEKVLEITVFV